MRRHTAGFTSCSVILNWNIPATLRFIGLETVFRPKDHQSNDHFTDRIAHHDCTALSAPGVLPAGRGIFNVLADDQGIQKSLPDAVDHPFAAGAIVEKKNGLRAVR